LSLTNRLTATEPTIITSPMETSPHLARIHRLTG